MLYKASEMEYIPACTVGWPPSFICHCCGAILPQAETGCYYAQIKFEDGADCQFNFCSDECVQTFKSHPAADRMINDLVKKSERLHRG